MGRCSGGQQDLHLQAAARTVNVKNNSAKQWHQKIHKQIGTKL